jgi:hypothetical protein
MWISVHKSSPVYIPAMSVVARDEFRKCAEFTYYSKYKTCSKIMRRRKRDYTAYWAVPGGFRIGASVLSEYGEKHDNKTGY